MVKTRQTISSSEPFEQDRHTLSTPFMAAESQYHEESRLINGPFESTLLDQGFSVEHELNAFNPPLTGTLLSPLTFAMTRNSTQTFSFIIPGQPFLETFMPLCYSNQDHTSMSDYIIPVLKQQAQHLLHLQRSTSRSDNQPLQFCLSILETFIPHSKIYRTTNYWQHAKCLLNPFIPIFLLTTTTSTKGFLSTLVLLNF